MQLQEQVVKMRLNTHTADEPNILGLLGQQTSFYAFCGVSPTGPQPGGGRCWKAPLEIPAGQNAPGERSNSDSWRTRGESPTPPPNPSVPEPTRPERGATDCPRTGPCALWAVSTRTEPSQASRPGAFIARADQILGGYTLRQHQPGIWKSYQRSQGTTRRLAVCLPPSSRCLQRSPAFAEGTKSGSSKNVKLLAMASC